jgi:hypothetical protein
MAPPRLLACASTTSSPASVFRQTWACPQARHRTTEANYVLVGVMGCGIGTALTSCRMNKILTDALEQKDLVVWTRDGKHYAVVGHKGHVAGVEHHISDAEFEELKTLGVKVEHAPHQVNG